MSLPLGVLVHKTESSTSTSIFSQTRRNHEAYHISTETSFQEESNDIDLQIKLNDLTYKNPRQIRGTSLVQGMQTIGLGFLTIQQYSYHLDLI